MNKTSLQHSYVQNQEISSWNDDPFDLKGLITGVMPLSHKSNLTEYALELVADYAEFIGNSYELNLDKISSPYQLELARLYIESIDREIEWACYGEDQSLNSEFLCAMLAMLKDSNPQTRANFAEITTKNILIYYKNTLQKILDIACNDFLCNLNEEENYHSYQNKDSGDFHWRKY